MIPLISIRKTLIWLNVCPSDDEISGVTKWYKIVRILLSCTVVITSLFGVGAFGMFILENVTNHLEDCLFTFMGFMISICTVYAIIFAYFSHHQIPSIFKQLTAICNESMRAFGVGFKKRISMIYFHLFQLKRSNRFAV